MSANVLPFAMEGITRKYVFGTYVTPIESEMTGKECC